MAFFSAPKNTGPGPTIAVNSNKTCFLIHDRLLTNILVQTLWVSLSKKQQLETNEAAPTLPQNERTEAAGPPGK